MSIDAAINAMKEPQKTDNPTFIPEIEEKNIIRINGKVFEIKPVEWEWAVRIVTRLGRMLAPAYGALQDGMARDPIIDGPGTTYADALSALSKDLDEEVFIVFSRQVLNGLTVDGKPVTEEYFKQNLSEWRQVFFFAMKENVSSFFDNGLEGFVQMMTEIAGQQESEQE